MIAATGFMTAYGRIISSVFVQGVVPGVVAATETSKRLSAKLIVNPVIMEIFEAPINTWLIEASVKEYAPGNTTPKADYNLNVQVDTAARTVTEISSPIK